MMTDAATAIHLLRDAPSGTVWLDAACSDRDEGRCLLFVDPIQILVARRTDEVEGVLAALDEVVEAGYYVAGYVAYEAGLGFEDVARIDEGAKPLVWFGVYEAPLELEAGRGSQAVEEAASGLEARVEAATFGLERDAYRTRVEAVKQAIREGDVYQINLTDAVTFDFNGHPLALFRDLRRRQRVSYGAFIHDGERHLLSLSPELFFRRDGCHMLTRPMKGTVRRGRTLEEDETLREWLSRDAKSRAENLMIVDLLRNDLSICCQPGTVRVPALFETERYETVIQMTSDVTGELREEVGYRDLFRALFPCGSVTGAPKIRAMQYIHALEDEARDVYCGAIGYVAPDERAVFNVAIRTIVLDNGRGRMGSGSGLVWDSDADAEYDECLLKARFLTEPVPEEAFELIETMRFEDGEIELLELHLDRLRASARYYDVRLDEQRLQARLRDVVGGVIGGSHRVRLTLQCDGTVHVTSTPLQPWAPEPLRLVLADERVHSGEATLFHKTSRRQRYDRAYERARMGGFDEALFVNERGEVTEGTRTNVFIRTGRSYVTPSLESGVLPGVYRRHLLDALPEVEERPLGIGDLVDADAIYVCNAVHGLLSAELLPAGARAVAEGHEKSQRPDGPLA